MAECHSIADSAQNPHPLLKNDPLARWPVDIPAAGPSAGRSPRASSVIVNNSFRS